MMDDYDLRPFVVDAGLVDQDDSYHIIEQNAKSNRIQRNALADVVEPL
jgi:hypothetical protein